jgi:hypothetical protein
MDELVPNKERIKSWIAALLSGEYKQGVNTLRHVDADGNVTWCCLGVATLIAQKANAPGVAERYGTRETGIVGPLPSREVDAYFGVDDLNAAIVIDGKTLRPSTFNDGDTGVTGQKSFREIAFGLAEAYEIELDKESV